MKLAKESIVITRFEELEETSLEELLETGPPLLVTITLEASRKRFTSLVVSNSFRVFNLQRSISIPRSRSSC